MTTGLFLLMIFPVILFIFILNFITAYKQVSREENIKREIQAPAVEFTIAERIGCIAHYDGQEIANRIKLEDGRIFEYISLAIKNQHGFYTSSDPSAFHIKVDGKLLYKQISDK